MEVTLADGAHASVPFSPLGSKRSASSDELPPPKLSKQPSTTRRSNSLVAAKASKAKYRSRPLHVRGPELASLVTQAVNSAIAANKAATAHSAAGMAGAGTHRSVLPTSTVTASVSEGAGHACVPLAGQDFDRTQHALHGYRHHADVPQFQPTLASVMPDASLGSGRPAVTGSSAPSLGVGYPGTERNVPPPPAGTGTSNLPQPRASALVRPPALADDALARSDALPPPGVVNHGGQAVQVSDPIPQPVGSAGAGTSASILSAHGGDGIRAGAALHAAPPPASIHPSVGDSMVMDDGDAVSVFGDASSQAGMDAQADADLSARPLQEVLQIVQSFLPGAVEEGVTSQEITSFLDAHMPSEDGSPAPLRAGQSPLLGSAVEAVFKPLRGTPSAACLGEGLPFYPSGAKPGKFLKPRPPPFLKEGTADGPVPRAPPPVTPADRAITSSTPAQNYSIPSSLMLSTEANTLTALELISVCDLMVSSMDRALFERNSAEFRADTEPIHVLRLLQWLQKSLKETVKLVTHGFLTSLLIRRDNVLAAAPGLSNELQTSLRLAPVDAASLFGPAAQAAAEVAARQAQQQALNAVCNIAVTHANRGSRNSGSRGGGRGRGSASNTTKDSNSRGQRGRGNSRSRSRGAKAKNTGKSKQATAATAAAPAQQTPQ